MGTAQEIPPIVSYSTEDYNAENQNWAISQADNKFIYVANNKGLLEFNGAKWKLYPSPNETIMRSVEIDGGRIYSGCYMEFGYWQRDDYGNLVYTSLSKEFEGKLIEDEQFWNIIALGDYIIFQSFNRIYIYNKVSNTFKTIDSDTTITKMAEVNGKILFQKLNQGVYEIINGEAELFLDDETLKSAYVVNFFQKGDHLLLITQYQGMLIYDGSTISNWQIPNSDALSDVSIYSGIKLNNGYALGTISDGIIILDEAGNVNYEINQALGLSNNTVLTLFEDAEMNLWSGLDNGIDCINMNSAFRIFRDNYGKLGTVYAASLYHNKLYLGTNQGLFFREYGTDADFTFVENTEGQVWGLKVYDNRLFVSHNIGTLILSDNVLTRVTNPQGTWTIQNIEEEPNLLLQGNYGGLSVLEKKDGNWKLRNKISGFDISSKYIGILNKNKVFINHEYKGVYILQLNEDFTEVLEVKIDNSLDKGFNSSLIKFDDEVLYAYKGGVYRYKESLERFARDSSLSQLYADNTYLSGKLTQDFIEKNLWGFTENDIANVSQGQLSEVPNINRISFPSNVRKMMIGYENILGLGKSKYLIGTSSGYIIMDLDMISKADYEISINAIRNVSPLRDDLNLKTSQPAVLKNDNAFIQFKYSVPEYQKFSKAEYQYRLKGRYEKWSNWSASSDVLYENLPYGDYTFDVRARIGGKNSVNTASYSFQVLKPWYGTNLALLLYVLAIIMVSLLTHSFYKSYYKRQRNRLILENKKDLELGKLENEQELMQLKNERLQHHIESKNRELAISTMSLIKKNEFLSEIRHELKNSDSAEKGLKKVIRAIDKNINNTDDWKFFQEAFDNADKDFLKKIKSMHPKLTPNDLKLCAYLRLNLTSKEIAPLLNISPRSVEVKRYRLRKKINLEHEESLTEYILSV